MPLGEEDHVMKAPLPVAVPFLTCWIQPFISQQCLCDRLCTLWVALRTIGSATCHLFEVRPYAQKQQEELLKHRDDDDDDDFSSVAGKQKYSLLEPRQSITDHGDDDDNACNSFTNVFVRERRKFEIVAIKEMGQCNLIKSFIAFPRYDCVVAVWHDANGKEDQQLARIAARVIGAPVGVLRLKRAARPDDQLGVSSGTRMEGDIPRLQLRKSKLLENEVTCDGKE